MLIVVLLAGFIAPGFSHGLLGRPRDMVIIMVAFALTASLIAFTIYALLALPIVMIGSAVHAGVLYRKLRPTIQWSVLYAIIAFVAGIGLALTLRITVVEAFKIPSSAMYPTLQVNDHIFVDKLSPHWRAPERGELIVFRQPCEPDHHYIKRVIGLPNDTIEIRCDVVYVNGNAIPRTLVQAKDAYDDHDEYQNTWQRRDVSHYRETQGGRSYDIYHDPEAPSRDASQLRHQPAANDLKDFPHDTIPPSCSRPDSDVRVITDQLAGQIVGSQATSDPCMLHLHYVVPTNHVFVLGDNRPNSNDSRYWGSVPLGNLRGFVRGIWKPLGRFGSVN